MVLIVQTIAGGPQKAPPPHSPPQNLHLGSMPVAGNCAASHCTGLLGSELDIRGGIRVPDSTCQQIILEMFDLDFVDPTP